MPSVVVFEITPVSNVLGELGRHTTSNNRVLTIRLAAPRSVIYVTKHLNARLQSCHTGSAVFFSVACNPHGEPRNVLRHIISSLQGERIRCSVRSSFLIVYS